MRKHLTTIALTAIAASAVAAPAATAKDTITMSGSTSVAPLVRELAVSYLRAYPNSTTFKLQQGGSDTGINDVARGRVTIGNASRKPQPSDPSGLVFNRIAYDAVCIITNPGNALPSLSQEQVQSIFTGRTRSWSQVPGAGATGAISVISRTATSGTADAFREIFLGNTLSVAASAQVKTSNGLVQQAVASDRGAIGFVSLDFLRGVSPISYQGVGCTLRNAKSGQYQGVRPFSLVTRGAPTGAAQRFIKWIQSNSAATAVVNKHWIPIR